MGCEQCREAVSARLDGEDAGWRDAVDVAAAIDAHLARCPACRRAADAMAALTELSREWEPGPDLVGRVLAAVEPARGHPGRAAAPSCGCDAGCRCGCQDGARCRCAAAVC